MPQVAHAAIKERARRLRAATARRKTLWLQSLVGTRQNVLVERKDGLGHAENFAPVRVAGGAAVGHIATVNVIALANDMLIGEERKSVVEGKRVEVRVHNGGSGK